MQCLVPCPYCEADVTCGQTDNRGGGAITTATFIGNCDGCGQRVTVRTSSKVVVK